jgi:16S rRNA (guanine527-N7)-methyltransferase
MSDPRPAPPVREPLPLDASGLPPLTPQALELLAAGLRAMELDLSPEVLAAIDAQARLLEAWGRHINLTAIREPVDVIRLHVLDSLAAVAPIRARMEGVRSLVDIGSGGGYPGIPLGLALGTQRLSLVESVGRKTRFLEVAGAAARAALDDRPSIEVEALPVRAETLAAGERRGTWEVATVRAVGSVAECAELGLPLLRVGGLLVCWKRDPVTVDGVAPGGGVRSEVAAARGLIGQLGGGAPEVLPADVPGTPGHRLVVVRKERPTPPSFPRPPAARRPRPSSPGNARGGTGRRAC